MQQDGKHKHKLVFSWFKHIWDYFQVKFVLGYTGCGDPKQSDIQCETVKDKHTMMRHQEEFEYFLHFSDSNVRICLYHYYIIIVLLEQQ